MIVCLSEQAKADVAEIGDWIAVDNPARAETFVDELIERSQPLVLHSQRFPSVAQVGGRAIRKLTHAGYLIFYVVAEREIYILRIVHGSRDWASLFEGA